MKVEKLSPDCHTGVKWTRVATKENFNCEDFQSSYFLFEPPQKSHFGQFPEQFCTKT